MRHVSFIVIDQRFGGEGGGSGRVPWVDARFFSRRFKGRDARGRDGVSFLSRGEIIGTRDMPAVPEDAVIGPIGRPGTYCGDGNIVDQEHGQRENGQRQETVGDHAVDPVGCCQPARGVLFIDAL